MPQFGQRIAADHRRQQQPVGLQRAADLRQHARQIVDELKGERGNREIERFRLQRQRLGLAIRQIDPRQLTDAPGQRVADLIARRADIGRVVEFPQHRLQPLRHILGDAIEQERRRPDAQGARLPGAQQGAVEQDRRGIRVRGHAGWYADPPMAGNPRPLNCCNESE